MKYQRLRGVKDVTPDETPLWEHIRQKSAEVFERYDYHLMITPTIEELALFVRGIGEGTDIVMKEMYDFKDKKGRHIVLRPEGTASIVRAYIENNLPVKSNIYYSGQMFRYERPQAGRYREFYQIGVESFGDATPYKDAEVIIMAAEIIKNIGVTQSALNINCLAADEGYYEKLKLFLNERKEELCEDCKMKLDRAPIRVLDCKKEECKKAVEGAPLINENLRPDAKIHYDKIKELLTLAGVGFIESPTMVRGLDYYTATVFEFVTDKLGPQQNTILAGGRYDRLVEELGGRQTPATGFALGMERMAEVLKAEGKNTFSYGPEVFIITDKAYQNSGFSLLKQLRDSGIKAAMGFEDKSFKSQFKEADTKKAGYVVVIGENEIKLKNFALKNMSTGVQEFVDFETIIKKVKSV
jgi:histidyl-tRNA synthetase